MASELQSLLDEAAGLMGWTQITCGIWVKLDQAGTANNVHAHPVLPTLDSILAAFEESLPWWRIRRNYDGALAATYVTNPAQRVFVKGTGHTVAAWRLDLARLLVAALRAKGGK